MTMPPKGFELRASLFIAIWFACVGTAIAQTNPQPPCEGARSNPEYAQPGKAPNVRVWNGGNPGKQWVPPSCTGWLPKDGILVAVAGQFRYLGSVDGLLSRFGAISTLRGFQYWSVTDNKWQTLITHATALDGPDLVRPRSDFTVSEMRRRPDLYFAETDNRSGQPIIYRMHVAATSTTFVVALENVTPVKFLMMTVFAPGDLQSVHFLTRTAPGVWSYYGLARTGLSIESFFGLNDASYINRALALYAHFTGVAIEPVLP